MKLDFDLMVIGGGSAGLTAAQLAAGVGRKVALIEREKTGGECLYTGCVPSKTLLSIAREVWSARSASRYGLECGGQTDWQAVKAQIKAVIARIEPQDSPEALERAGVHVIAGEAKFVGDHTLEVRGQRYRAARFILATGASPLVPDAVQGLPYHTTDSIFDLERLPTHLAILGGGAVAAELGQAFARLGSRVTILARGDRLVSRFEPEVSRLMRGVLEREGVEIRLRSELLGGRVWGETLELSLKNDAPLRVSHLLIAAGKHPRVQGLGLEQIGANFDEHGLKTDAVGRSSCLYLWGAGDVLGRDLYTHAAGEEAIVALLSSQGLGLLARWRAPQRQSYPRALFTDPEVAAFGPSETEARELPGKVQILEYPFAKLDRARTDGTEEGFVKLIFSSSRLSPRLLGATVVGPRAAELLYTLETMYASRIHPLKLASPTPAYPSYAEALRYAVMGLYSSSEVFGSRR